MSRVPSPTILIKPSGRKAAAGGQLTRLGLKVSDGYDYQFEEALVPGMTWTRTRELLKGVSGSISDVMIDERRQA